MPERMHAPVYVSLELFVGLTHYARKDACTCVCELRTVCGINALCPKGCMHLCM